MTLSQKILRLATVLVPLSIFCASLFFNGFSYQYIKVETVQSYMLLLMGGAAFIGGGMLETIIWLANPRALCAIIRFLLENRTRAKIDPILNQPIPKLQCKSGWLSVLAAGLSLSFALWDEVLATESGTMGKILVLHTGYWLWTFSLSLFAIGVNYYNYQYYKGS